MTENKYKYAVRTIKSSQLSRALTLLKANYMESGEQDYLVVPYILTCAAALESKLNDAFQETEKKFGPEYANAMMALSLPNKLKLLVPTLTDGEYLINKEHFVYQRLISLIRVRNTLAHAKSELKEIEQPSSPFMGMPMFLSKDAGDLTLGAAKSFTPPEYHDALLKLDKWFFQRCPDRLSKVEMVIAHTKEGKWEEQIVTYRKYLD